MFPHGNTVAASGLVSASLSSQKQTDHRHKHRKPSWTEDLLYYPKQSLLSISLPREGWQMKAGVIPRRSSSRNQCEIGLLLSVWTRWHRLIAPSSSQLNIIMNPRNNSRGNQRRILKEVKRKAEWLGIPGLEEHCGSLMTYHPTEGNIGPVLPSSQPSNRWLLR